VMAAGLWVWFVLRIPWYGTAMLTSNTGPGWFARFLQQGYGLAAIACVFVLLWVARCDADQRVQVTR
jgi:hypothetical protein